MKLATACALVALALVSCSAPATRPSSSPAPGATPPVSESPIGTASWVVYFARDLADPLAVALPGPAPGSTIEGRVRQRMDVLAGGPRSVDGGAFNVLAGMKAQLAVVTVVADLATLDFRVPQDDWGIDGSTMLRAFVQQVVYTASEEPGIARVLVTQNGGRQGVVGGEGLVISAPQSRAGLGYLGLTPDEAARFIRASVTGARPLLIPIWVPADWTVAIRADADTFHATYTDPTGTRTVTLAITLANIPLPTAVSSQALRSSMGIGPRSTRSRSRPTPEVSGGWCGRSPGPGRWDRAACPISSARSGSPTPNSGASPTRCIRISSDGLHDWKGNLR